jgi:hypothetical protein
MTHADSLWINPPRLHSVAGFRSDGCGKVEKLLIIARF